MCPFRFAKLWLTIGWILVTLIVLFSLIPAPPQLIDIEQGDKLSHLIAYMTLMLWFANIYPQNRHRILLCLGFFAMGLCLEMIQGALDYRSFQYADLLANTLGVLLGWSLAHTRFANCLIYLDNWLENLTHQPTC
jgi:glycopeptide antibiotics resistance protein